MEVSIPNYLVDNALFIITRELCMKCATVGLDTEDI